MTGRELSGILAGLRLLQLVLDNDGASLMTDNLRDIYTNGGTEDGIASGEIDVLCARLNESEYFSPDKEG